MDDRRAIRAVALLSVLAWFGFGTVPARAADATAIPFTARACCEIRALSARHPDPALRGPDDLAGRLCEPLLLPREYDFARDVIDIDPERYSGFFYVSARTRFIDAVLERALADGIGQVVILGAGLDSRAWRFGARRPAAVFFEVDRPAAVAEKRRRVARALAGRAANVRFVAQDFDEGTLARALPAAGWDAARRTLFIVEGVTMYVSAAGNDDTFEFIGTRAARGSRVVFDYLWRRVAQRDTAGLYAASSAAAGVASAGEPFVSGWTPEDVPVFVTRHGLEVIEHLGADDLERRELTGSDGRPDGRIPPWYGIVLARRR